MSIPTQHEYEMREMQEFHRQLTEAGRDSLSERKESCANFLDAMRHRPEVVQERIEWLIDGNYGYGAMQAAKKVIANKRMNRRAWLTHTIGALEWRCPGNMAIAGWKKLTAAEKKALDRAVNGAIAYAHRKEE